MKKGCFLTLPILLSPLEDAGGDAESFPAKEEDEGEERSAEAAAEDKNAAGGGGTLAGRRIGDGEEITMEDVFGAWVVETVSGVVTLLVMPLVVRDPPALTGDGDRGAGDFGIVWCWWGWRCGCGCGGGIWGDDDTASDIIIDCTWVGGQWTSTTALYCHWSFDSVNVMLHTNSSK